MGKKYQSVDEYVADFPGETGEILKKIKRVIREVAPNAAEVISYNMPAFRQDKILVYFAAYPKHIGFYALPSGNEAFKQKLENYKVGKGSIQFPLNQEMPYDLIREMVRFRLEEVNQS